MFYLIGRCSYGAISKDSGGKTVYPLTKRLGSLSGKNNSRDWWRALKDGPVAKQHCSGIIEHKCSLEKSPVKI